MTETIFCITQVLIAMCCILWIEKEVIKAVIKIIRLVQHELHEELEEITLDDEG
jgi:hypothetical protein